jgi:hypothetical protein
MFQDRGSIIRYNSCLFSLDHLIHSLWSQTCTNGISNAWKLEIEIASWMEKKPFAAVMFDLRTSMGFSLSWNLLPLTPVWVCVCAMLERCDELKCQEIEGERIW